MYSLLYVRLLIRIQGDNALDDNIFDQVTGLAAWELLHMCLFLFNRSLSRLTLLQIRNTRDNLYLTSVEQLNTAL